MSLNRDAVTEAVALLAMVNGCPDKARDAIKCMSDDQVIEFINVLEQLCGIAIFEALKRDKQTESTLSF